MKHKSIIEVEANSLAEQQMILARFPDARWIALDENKTKFYIQYQKYNEVKNMIEEWEKRNDG